MMQRSATRAFLKSLPWIGLLLALGVFARQEGELQQGMVNPGYEEKPEWFKNSFLDIREDIDEARQAGRRVLLYFYQDGCPYCAKLLKDNLSQADIEKTLRKGFDVIAINLWGDRDVTGFDGKPRSEKKFAVDLKVMYTPTLVFLDDDGKVRLRINGYYPPDKFRLALAYASERGTRSFRAFLTASRVRNNSGPVASEAGFMRPPFRLPAANRHADRPLAVFFEEPDCRPCEEWHADVLKRPEVAATLKRFDALTLNLWAKTPLITPDGRRIRADAWARELGITYAPSVVFFDTEGRQVFRTEAYLKAFHLNAALNYVLSGAYREQPEFQRFVDDWADALRARGVEVELMK